VLLAIGALVRGARQLRWKEALEPRPWLLAAYVIAFPCVLMVRFSNPLRHTSAQLATGLAVTLGVAIIAGLGARGSKLRWALAASAFCCCLAVGLLVMEQTEMLEGFMLWYGV
jgi:hypothetical protein